jgi:hypothetical protein
MKKIIVLLIVLTSFTSIAMAMLPSKLVVLPFENEPLFSATHAGLFFSYDMDAKQPRKVLCNLQSLEGGFFRFNDWYYQKDTLSYYGSVQIILSNKLSVDDDRHFHADAVGGVQMIDGNHNKEPTKAIASCHYEPDDM